MKTSSNKKQNNLLGEFGYKVLGEIGNGENTVIYSLPGMGLDTITKEVVREFLTQTEKNRIINIYPHESFLRDYNEISKLLIEKFALENPLEDNSFSSIRELEKHINKENAKLLIVLNKLNRYKFINELSEYFYYLTKGVGGKITVLATEITGKEYIDPNNKIISNRFCFKGFQKGKSFETLVKRIQLQLNKKNPGGLSRFEIDELFSNTLGHAGLTKELIKLKPKDPKIFNPNIINRLNTLLQQLDRDGISLKDTKNLERLGMASDGKLGRLYESYIKKFINADTNVVENLTSTEEEIFRFLRNQPDYVSVDAILNHLEKTKFDTQSVWALYKHVNNLKKKLEKENIFIESKRNKGYKLNRQTL